MERDHAPEKIFDLSDPGAVTRWAKGMRDAGDPIDVLFINNGAQWLKGPMDSHDAYSIVSTITSGVTGTLLLTRGLLPLTGRLRGPGTS